MQLRRSAEDYLEAIYILKGEKGAVHSIDVAHYLDFSKPSVSRAVNNLRADGYLDMLPDGELMLTDKGQKTAETIYERHTLLTQLFESIGVPHEVAVEDACRVEHAISAETFACLKAVHQNHPASAETGAGDEKPRPGKADKKKKKKK